MIMSMKIQKDSVYLLKNKVEEKDKICEKQKQIKQDFKKAQQDKKYQQIKMNQSHSPLRQNHQPTYSQIFNYPKKTLTSVQFQKHSPFNMILAQSNQYHNNQQTKASQKIPSYKQFVKEDLHRNPLAESVNGAIQIKNSQISNSSQSHTDQYFPHYEAKQNIYQIPTNTYHNKNSNQKERKIFVNQNQQKMDQQNGNISPLEIQRDPYYTFPPSSSLLINQVLPYQNQQNLSVSNSGNEEISEVKYRLDELMKKFPFNKWESERKNQNWKKKPMATFEGSAPQLYLKKSGSFQKDHHSNGVLLNFSPSEDNNQQHFLTHPNCLTQKKIIISQPSQPQKNESKCFPSLNSKIYHPESLNYSQSTMKNGSVHFSIQKNVESLYKQIQQQQQVISTYKKIIYRLQNDNMHLSSLLLQIQTQKKNLQNQIQNQYHQKLTNQPQTQLSNSHQNSLSKDQNSKNNMVLERQFNILKSQKSQLLNKIVWLNNIIENLMSVNNNNKKNTQKSNLFPQSSNLKDIYQHNEDLKCQQVDIDGRMVIFNESVPVQTSFMDPITENFDQFNYKRLYEKEIGWQQKMKEEMHDLQMLQQGYDQQFKKVLQQIKNIKINRKYYLELKRQIGIKKQMQKQRSKQRQLEIRVQNNKQRQRSQFKKHIHTQKQTTFIIKDRYKTAKLTNKVHYNKNTEQVKTIQQEKKSEKQKQSTFKQIFQNQIIYHLKNQNEILKNNLHNLTKQIVNRQKQYQINSPQKYPHFLSTPNIPFSQLKQSHVISSLGKQSLGKQSLGKQCGNKKIVSRNPNLDEFKNKQRPESKLSIVDKLKKRPKSFVQIPQKQIFRMSSLNKSNVNKNRKNGKISYLSSSNLSQRNNVSQSIKWEHENRKNLSMSGQMLNEQEYQIPQQKSSNYTQQSNKQLIISRYNNFIKNMKKKFGINSTIIGKQITKANEELGKASLNISVNGFQQP